MEQSGTKAVYRALDLILELGHHPTGASVSILAEHLAVPPSTVHRLLRALVERRFAVQDSATKRYALGTQIVSLANQAATGAKLAAVARPRLERLASMTRETIFLSMLDGEEIVYLDCILSTRSIQMWGAPGMRAPLHATSQGKVILAFLPEDKAQALISNIRYLPFTERTISDDRTLRRELSRIREQGFAINDEEHEDGVRSVSAPVFDSSDSPIGAVCVGMPAFRITLDDLRRRIAPAVVNTAKEISQRITGFGAEDGAYEAQRDRMKGVTELAIEDHASSRTDPK